MNEPTTLIVPDPPLAQSPPGGPEAWAAMSVAVLIPAALAVLVLRRRRNLPPDERAFRALCHRMGLSRKQVNRVRRYARSRGIPGPVAVLMSGQLLGDALGENRRESRGESLVEA